MMAQEPSTGQKAIREEALKRKRLYIRGKTRREADDQEAPPLGPTVRCIDCGALPPPKWKWRVCPRCRDERRRDWEAMIKGLAEKNWPRPAPNPVKPGVPLARAIELLSGEEQQGPVEIVTNAFVDMYCTRCGEVLLVHEPVGRALQWLRSSARHKCASQEEFVW